jgi:hypothetical protein
MHKILKVNWHYLPFEQQCISTRLNQQSRNLSVLRHNIHSNFFVWHALGKYRKYWHLDTSYLPFIHKDIQLKCAIYDATSGPSIPFCNEYPTAIYWHVYFGGPGSVHLTRASSLHQPYLQKIVLADQKYTVVDVFAISSNFTYQQQKMIRSILL